LIGVPLQKIQNQIKKYYNFIIHYFLPIKTKEKNVQEPFSPNFSSSLQQTAHILW
jgi:hypothetical protein